VTSKRGALFAPKSINPWNLHVMTLPPKELGRYYTKESVAAVLVRSIDACEPKTVVDLGAGDGTLISQAAIRWNNARFVTADIDASAASRCLPQIHGSAYSHYSGDALDASIGEKLGVTPGSACVAICNPPYVRAGRRDHFRKLLDEVGLSGVLPKAQDLPVDVLFVAQNLRLLKVGGKLGLILPDGLIAGERFAAFRHSLIAQHAISQVIELPRNIFKRTEAKAHILILSRSVAQTEDIAVRRLDELGELSEPFFVPPERAAERLDYSFYSMPAKGKPRSMHRLGDLIDSVVRGSFSSKTRAKQSFPVLHTTDLPDLRTVAPPGFEISKRHSTGTAIVAHTGDILMGRVGRNLSSKICRVTSGSVVPSDCLLVIRPLPGQGDKLIQTLTSAQGRRAIDAVTHGVGAKFVTVKGLLDLRI
jgi:type I restriction enzyme M protein